MRPLSMRVVDVYEVNPTTDRTPATHRIAAGGAALLSANEQAPPLFLSSHLVAGSVLSIFSSGEHRKHEKRRHGNRPDLGHFICRVGLDGPRDTSQREATETQKPKRGAPLFRDSVTCRVGLGLFSRGGPTSDETQKTERSGPLWFPLFPHK